MACEKEHEDFYLRYHVGQKGRFGVEFLEFELLPGGKLRYANNSDYGQDGLIRREICLGPAVVEEIKQMVRTSDVIRWDDSLWAEPFENNGGIQELEVKLGCHHVSFATTEIGSLLDIKDSADHEGLKRFYYFASDLRSLIMALITCHFKERPFG